MQIVNSKLKYFNMIILGVFSDFSSVESEFCIEEKFGIKLDFVSISHVTSMKPKSVISDRPHSNTDLSDLGILGCSHI